MAKRGPKPKIDEKAITEIYACLTVGASLQDAADYIGIARSTLTRFKKRDAKFAQGCLQAIKKGKLHHLNKIGKAPQWQASAFMLQAKWGREYGNKDKMKVEHSGGIEVRHKFDYGRFQSEIVSARSRVSGANPLPPSNGNGKSVHPVDPQS